MTPPSAVFMPMAIPMEPGQKPAMSWATTEAMMALTKETKDGEALYMHPLPADITGLSCEQGEVDRPISNAASTTTSHS